MRSSVLWQHGLNSTNNLQTLQTRHRPAKSLTFTLKPYTEKPFNSLPPTPTPASDLQKCEAINRYGLNLLNSRLFVTQLTKPTHCLTLWGICCEADKEKERKEGSPYCFLWAGQRKSAEHFQGPSTLALRQTEAVVACKHVLYDNISFSLLLFFFVSCCKLSREVQFLEMLSKLGAINDILILVLYII